MDELDRALLLARTGVALEDSVATRGNLLAALLRVPRGSLGVLPDVRDNAIYGIALSPRGDRIAIGDHLGEVRLFDARTRRELASYRLQPGLVQRLAFSPDGATLAVAGQEPENEPPGALIDLLDARTLERRQRIVLPPPPQGGIAGASPVFTADGRALTVLQIPFSGPAAGGVPRRPRPRRGGRPPIPLPRRRERPRLLERPPAPVRDERAGGRHVRARHGRPARDRAAPGGRQCRRAASGRGPARRRRGRRFHAVRRSAIRTRPPARREARCRRFCNGVLRGRPHARIGRLARGADRVGRGAPRPARAAGGSRGAGRDGRDDARWAHGDHRRLR